MAWKDIKSGAIQGGTKHLTYLIIGVLIMILGLDPKTWIASIVSNPPEWLDGPFLKFGIIGIGLLFIILWMYLRGREINYKSPQATWIELSAIPFEVHRRDDILSPSERWNDYLAKSHIVGLMVDQRPFPPDMPFNPSAPALRIKGNMDFVYGGIDWERRRFVWRWKLMTVDKGPFGVAFHPWDIDEPKSGLETILGEPAPSHLKSRARFTWQLMTEILDDLVVSGRLVVWARFGSSRVPFEKIGPDTWRHFKVTDWEAGQARNPSDETLYSINFEINK